MKRLPSLALPIFLIALHLFVLVNLRFEAWPEMVIYPYLIHHGFKLYTDIVNPYPPLFNWFLAGFFKLVGLSLLNLKLLTWSLIALIDTLIYTVAFKKYGHPAALAGLLFFVVFQPLLDGNGLWFDLALVPVLLGAFYWRSPALLSLGFFIKQSVIWFFPLAYRQWRKLFTSLIILFATSYVLLAGSGAAADYLFWAWRFPFTLGPLLPGYKDFGDRQFWVVALVSFLFPLALYIVTKPKLKSITSHHPLAWLILSFPFLFPRFGLFHLQPPLAFAALLVGHSWKKIKTNLQPRPFAKVALLGYSFLIISLWSRHLKLYWHQPTRFFEPVIYEQAQTLANLTSPEAPTFLLNTPAQILWLSGRLPTKPWVDTFPWYYEVPGVQEKVIVNLQKNLPQAVLFSPYQNNSPYTPGSYSPKRVDEFVKEQYPVTTELDYPLQLLYSSLAEYSRR